MNKKVELIGLQDPRLTAYECPNCIDERLIRVMGTLVCRACDFQIEESRVIDD